MRYTVVYSEYLTSFEQRVNELLAAGWQLQGGVTQAKGFFYQAMVQPDAS